MELEDQDWFPSFLRNQQTAFIGFVAGDFGIYKPLLPQLKSLLEIKPNETWTDCCSGSAGPILFLQKKLFYNGQILLTDKFPNEDFKELSKIKYLNVSLDILKDEIPNNGLVTMFNAFHHFNVAERKQVVQKLIKNDRPFLIAEILEPTVLEAVKIFAIATIGQILLAPFVKPFSIKRLIFTYLIPLNIFTVLFDGIASVIRAVPFRQLENIAESVNSKEFEVKAVKHKIPLAVVTCLVGKPV